MVQALFNKGMELHMQGEFAQANEIYQQILKLQPKHFDTLFMYGMLLAQTGQMDLAIEINDKVLVINPSYAPAYSNRGIALNALKQHQAAIASFDKAIALDPRYLEAYCNRGIAFNDLKQYQAAIDSMDKAIALDPNCVEAYAVRGSAAYVLGQQKVALDSYDKAISLRPGFAAYFHDRGHVLNDMKQHQAALDNFDKAITIQPTLSFAAGIRLHTKMMICDWGRVDEQIHDLLNMVLRDAKVSPPFPILAFSDSLLEQRKAAETWVKENHPPNSELGPIIKRPKEGKIKIGYFSNDLRNHATAYLIAEFFERHNKDKFELIAFSFGPNKQDEMQKRLSAAFCLFIDVQNHSPKDIALLSRSLGVDIAIDLKGFTGGYRASIFSYRAAPIQVNYLGYPGTMGADYIDYLLADKVLIPERSQPHYAEKIAYLPNSYQVNDTHRKISDKVFTRQELGLPAKGFVFCCFNNNYKITPVVFDGWMRILGKVPGSVLWLFEGNSTASENLRRAASQRGVDAQRLVFAERMPLPEHLARHRAADLFIDTYPCSAHTTASDALWAGLPLLTYAGESFASRVAASCLYAIDLPELVTTTENAYEGLAVELATNTVRLEGIKQKLERNRLTTSLFDITSLTKHIESAYVQMYDRYHADLSPEHIYVEE